MTDPRSPAKRGHITLPALFPLTINVVVKTPLQTVSVRHRSAHPGVRGDLRRKGSTANEVWGDGAKLRGTGLSASPHVTRNLEKGHQHPAGAVLLAWTAADGATSSDTTAELVTASLRGGGAQAAWAPCLDLTPAVRVRQDPPGSPCPSQLPSPACPTSPCPLGDPQVTIGAGGTPQKAPKGVHAVHSLSTLLGNHQAYNWRP